MVIEADIDVDPDFEGYPIQDCQGTVRKLYRLSPTIKGIHLDLDGEMMFQAGSILT